MKKFYITDRCVGCGACAGACHGRCISKKDGKMYIDENRCLSCGSCMTVCTQSAILEVGDTYDHPAHDPIVMDADIVVVGAGAGGLVAAARIASISDKKVVVLEKMPVIGGGLNFASDWRIYNSKWQEKRGIPNLMQEKIQAAMDATNWQLDNKLVYQAYANTGKFFDWFETLVPNATFVESNYVFDIPKGGQIIPMPINKQGMKSAGLFTSEALQNYLEEKQVPILTRHKVVDFEVTDGTISAVVAQDPGGSVKVNCKAVILSTGSWISNKTLMDKICPEFGRQPVRRDAHTSLAYTGDGLPLAEKAGAYIDYGSLCLRLMGPMSMAPGNAAGAITRSGACLYVNKEGKRWICEATHTRLDNAFGLAQVLVNQPDGVSFTLFEKNMVDELYKRLDGKPLMGKADDHPQHPIPIPDDYAEELALFSEPDGEMKVMMRGGIGGPGGMPPMGDVPGEGVPGGMPGMPGMGGNFFVADTLEELAKKAGINYDGLKSTVENYNKMCGEGFDKEFFKAPEDLIPFGSGPFYACKGELATDGAFGGIQIDADTRVYSDPVKKTVVSGLYVPGDLSASRFLNYNGVKVQVINDLAWAVSSGYSAAEAAVADLV